ncbi:type IX secretion system membrane protein PorP/SprF [Fulvivirga sp. M361]|uniref:PorP/SprF family type IX secretion system membrane protein n=1 Tax=Fulvivirga sp. M361 TaxID=2594266 RepID=UPI00117B2A4E|nr:PorP/SprF family type IX secretion system membrane protein [Fulvivirga sp. M361]TRX51868.1 type IX secretion system membrane protein PorP/SprF [Fulvivirga sp. M361]
MKKPIYTVLLLFILSVPNSHAQEPRFSQFYANPVFLNPALAGIAKKDRFIVAHRQLGADSNLFTTSSVSMDGTLGTSSGWGAQVLRDSQFGGLMNTTSYNISLAHRIKLGKNNELGLGLKMGIYQKTLDWGRLTFEDQFDERMGLTNSTNEAFGRNSVSNGDISVGLLYTSEHFFGGYSISHINRPKEDFFTESDQRLSAKYTLHAGGIINLKHHRKEGHKLSPNFIYERIGQFEHLNLGMYYGADIWTVGTWYRWDDALVFSLGMNLNSVKLGYSIDKPLSDSTNTLNTAHEITFAYSFTLVKKQKVKNTYKGKCPSFQKLLF